uniref:Uncharacterized protein n=1 Tax=Periophthalmus magnuspinnatus TaxID=409849 RepID=A0A3B4ATD7_9GOBI
MPCGNGLTLSKRKHGVCVPGLGVLVALCCLEVWGSEPRGCSPCPLNCSCVLLPGPLQSCAVNCSNIGLEKAPAATDLPLATNVRDLSNNQITTVKERICDNLCNLTQDLSSNPLECDCKLFRLVSWLQKKGVQVRRPGSMLCNRPSELQYHPLLNISQLTMNYVACLEDNSSGAGGRSELVIFSSSTPGNFSREQCTGVCLMSSHRYGGLGARRECLCSTNSEPNFISESHCSAACTNPRVMEQQVSAQSEVTVMLPPKLQLLCPSLAVANKSLEISLLSWGALGLNIDWKITRDSVEIAKSPHCPGGVVHNETSHCFQILPEKMNWTDARQQCLDRGGDLAMVRTDALRGLLALNVTERGVWLGLSDVQSPGKLLWVNGSEAQEGEEGPPPRSALTRGNICIFLDQRGQTSSHSCNIKRARVPDAGVYIVGLAVFPTHSPLVLLFPTLTFIHAGRVSSLEVVTQELHTQVQVRFQTYRPHCHYPDHHLLLPGTETKDPPSCPPLQQWCPFQQQCLSLSVPCSPSSCSNCSQAHRLPHKARRPRYMLQNEVVFTLPAGPSAHIQDLLVSPGDVFALQHDAGPGSLLRCQPASHSLWHQSVLAINQSEWFWLNNSRSYEEHEAGRIPDPELDIEALLVDGEGRWEAEVVCPVRVLYAGHSETQLQCLLRVVPPLGLTIIHPTLQNGSIYLQPNDTHILLRVQSRYSTTVTWSGTNHTVTFVPTCPSEFVSHPGLCQASSNTGSQADPSEPSQYAVLDLGPGLEGQERPMHLELEAHNNVTEASLSVAVHLEEALQGLMVQPHPTHRVLMESVVSYTASVAQGSNPTFKWTVDDKPYFTYYNTVLNVIYQHAAVYKLTVTAMNHVSTITQHFNVTVDRLVPMANLSVQGVPDVVPQGSIQTFTTSVLLDMSMTATFIYPALVSVSNRYENISQTINMSVYSILNHVDIQTEPQLLLVGQVAQFEAHPLPSPYGIHYNWHLGDGSAPLQGRRVNHTYTHSGVFNICVLVNNTISSHTAYAVMFVFEKIENLTANTSSPSELHSPTIVWAHIISGNNVTWTFSMGDGSVHTISEPYISHQYKSDGNYTVNVTASNAVSSAWIILPVHVFIFQIVHIEPAGCVHENTPINFLAFVTGNSSAHLYKWKFGDDNTIDVRHGNPQTSHTYATSGNYNLTLSISSGVSKATKDVLVCVEPALQNISFTHEKSHYAVEEEIWFQVRAEPNFNYSYEWDFGQGDNPVLAVGSGNVATKYTDPGHYIVTVTVFNNISSLNTSVKIEVQMPIGPIAILHNSTNHNNLTLREPYAFHTSSLATNVSYTWHFGDGIVHNGPSIVHTYNISGNYNVTLTAVNTVSSNQTILSVVVLAPIRNLTLNSSLINVPLNASVNFEAHMDEGDGVRYSWILCDHCSSIVGTNTMFYTFRSVGTFTIIVIAENDINTTQASILLFVQRELEGLYILPEDELSCIGPTERCYYATNRLLHLQAGLKEGTNMTFTWNLIREFEPHLSVYNITGKTVEVNFSSPGHCNISLRADNLLGHLTVDRTINFLEPVGMVSLKISQNPVALNSPIHISVLANKGSNLKYRWWINKDVLQWNMSFKTHSFDTAGLKSVEIEVFNEVSSYVLSETVRVQENITGLRFTINSTELTYISTGVINWLQGEVATGTNVTWTWTVDGQTETGNGISHTFLKPKHTVISLKASNDISEDVVSRDVVVQDMISGLVLKGQKCVPVGKEVEFTVMLATGTDPDIVLSINGENILVMQPNQTHRHTFTKVDEYMVTVTAKNKGPEHCSTLNFGLGSSGPVLGISGVELEAGVEYTFKLTISKDGMAPESTTQTVLVQSGHIPMVYLECVSCKAQSFNEVSQNSKIYLKGTCTNCEGLHRGRWTAKKSQNESLVLDSSTTTTGSDGMHLVLRQGALPEGDSYIFTLHVTDSRLDGEGAASITLQRNMPPAGGECHLKAGGEAGVTYSIEDGEIWRIQTLVDRVQFNCSFSDVGVSETPLLYSLLVTRCREEYCEDFCVYRGSSPEHAAFLPPGFSSTRHRVAVSITVEDHQGATNTALNSLEVELPDHPLQYSSLPHWLSDLTDTKLKKLLEQGDSQRVRELSLALITVLNEYEQTRQRGSQAEHLYRVRVRSNITRALTSLDLTTVNDIQQTSAALAQCTAVNREFICEECQNSTLKKLESMLKILQTDTKQGTVTPTEIADNILNIMDLIHQPHPLRVAAKAYNLSSVLMLILMHARVLNEEPLRLRGAEIAATGKLADPQSLLCYQVESNPFPFNYVPNYTVSTEVASMEFRTENGTQIPISGLDDSLAITVAVNNGSIVNEGGSFGWSAPGLPTAGSVNISHCDSVIVKVNARNTNRQAGLFVQLNFYIIAYLHSHDRPNEFNCTDKKHIALNMTRGQDLDHKKFTFFLSPSYDTTLEYFINVSTSCSSSARPVGVHLEVGVFASLCQYFNESDKQWRTDGMVPLAETNATRAVCRTRHLTAFAAGLFVPPNAISFKIPERYGAPSLVVLLMCVLGLLSYVVAAAILHKLDQIDLRRAGVVPLCGQEGLFKYEVQVKTGWSQGATTAHVGISLYGRESRSGHRHLDSRGAFTRNALDIFHIATDTSLGNVWKIRIWHDNKWLLQYVLVKDLQTGSSYYFLVDDWLSVDSEKTGRKVEIEVEASDATLRQLPRLLRTELERAVCESHLWVSLWERPPRSPFTRLQRATCCALLLQLILMANTLWYSIVLNGETVAAGIVGCLVVYPIYLLVFTLFRMSRSKCVTVEQVPPQVDQESVEIDDFLDNSMAGSSFLFFSGETNSEETNVDLPTPSTKEEDMEDRDWPELMSEVSAVGGAGHGAGLPRLKRGQGSRHLGVDIAFNPDNEDGQPNKYFTSSEDLIKHILADGQNFFPEADESEMADSSIFGDKTEVILLQKLNEPLPLETVRRDPPKTAFTSNTVTDVCRPRRFPPWCGRAALWGSWAGITLANVVSIWAGHGFSQKVAMMWLISCFSSVLCSCLLLEPIKVICEAAYYAVCVRRLRPEDQDVLVEFPRVERVVQRVHRVRPPQGFALSQARQQARKVHMLHTMLKREDVVMWLNGSLLPRLLDDSRLLQDTGSVLLAVVVEFPLYNINTNLLAVFSFVFNFPVSERAQSSLNLLVTSVWPITGLDLPLLLTQMILFVLIMYFLIRGILGYLKQGYTYLLSSWRLLGVCKLVLALSVCGLHISRCIMAKQQWTFYLRHQRITFTDFYPVAKQSQLYTVMSALLLFILVLKASHQLRFLREWAVFGRTLRRSGWELLSLTLALLLLVLAYAHTGHLLFHSVFDGYSTVSTACMSLLGTGGRGVLFWKPVSAMNAPSSSVSTLMFHTSFAVLRLLVVWFVIAVLLRNYRRARAELYRPAVDLQDYEMVELFLRRLKMWMGLSRAKEFRHKVHFEGMDLPPSRSSSTSDCRSLCLPPLDRPDSPSTPDSVDGGSEASWRPASSSPCSLTEAPGATLGLGFGLGLGLSPGVLVGGASWKEKAETEAALGRVLPTLDALLQQLDRVTMATEDLYYVECKLEKAQKKRRVITPAPTTPGTSTCASTPTQSGLSSSSLFNHPAHTTTIPTHKRKRKPPPLKNKVHPN